MNLSIYRYKPDQGRLTRGSAFWLSSLLIYYGVYTLYFFLHWEWAYNRLVPGDIPIVNLPVDMRLLVCTVVFLGAEWFVVWIINRPGLGDLLIETETEMKKVTWPSWDDALNSSFVVLITVIFFMVFLGFTDVLLTFIFNNIIFGGAA